VAENFLQHAEHYLRLLNEAMSERQERQDNQQPSQQPGQQPGMERPHTSQPNIHEAEAGSEKIVASDAGSGQLPGEADNRPDNRSNNRGEGRGEGRRNDHDPRDSEVTGLTMIDSGNGDSGSLLVDVEELGSSQPRRRSRRRDQEPAETPAPADADSSQSE